MRERDEYASFDRPGRKSRPRTKDRPDYSEAAVADVMSIDRGRYRLVIGDGAPFRAMKARGLGRQSVVVGDAVRVVGDTSGADGSLARIVEVLPRVTVLRRTADDDDPIERVIVANADQMVIVAALADPPLRLGLIDRCLIAAFDAGVTPLVCLTKADLADPEPVRAQLNPLGVRTIAVDRNSSLDEIRSHLDGHTSVLVGHSGVGKSTLVNRLVPDADRATSSVNENTGRGRHTSTSAIMLQLPGTGRIIDTPGIRSFGLAHVDSATIIEAFDDIDDLVKDCPRGCTHSATEPECALDTPAASNVIEGRITTLRRILAAKSAAEDY